MTNWSTAVPDWRERITSGRSLLPKLPLIEKEAARGEAIFDRLMLPDVPGQPTMAQAAGAWQRDLVRAVFGSYDPGTNERHVREFFAMVPKKSNKTTLGAAIMLTAVLMNRRPRAEFLLIAPSLEVADLAFRQAVGMIQADPVLDAKFQIQEHIKRIIYRETRAFLKVKSFDPKTVTGSKPSGVLIDELHVMSQSSDADRVLGQIKGGMLPNPEAFLITITTQSERPPTGVFKSGLHSARNVRDGKISLPLLPLIYEFPENVDWRDHSNWWMVTPNNGLSISVDRLIPDYEAAVAAGEGELRRWASQHLYIEVGIGQLSDGWAGVGYWERRADPSITLDALLARSEVVVIGIDGGGLDDLFGLAVLGRDAATKDWLLWSHAWCHVGVLERRKSIASRLQEFAADGDLTIVDDELDDVTQIVDVARRVLDEGILGAVAVDPAGLGELVDAMAAIDVTQDNGLLIGVGQGYRLMNAIKTAERMLASGKMRHAGSALMAWCVGNVRIEPTATAIRATKMNAGDAKIDPWAAAMNAVDIMTTNPEPQGGQSIYDTLSDAQAASFGLQSTAPAVQTPVDGARISATDRQILADPHHPGWQAARERYDMALAAADEEEW